MVCVVIERFYYTVESSGFLFLLALFQREAATTIVILERPAVKHRLYSRIICLMSTSWFCYGYHTAYYCCMLPFLIICLFLGGPVNNLHLHNLNGESGSILPHLGRHVIIIYICSQRGRHCPRMIYHLIIITKQWSYLISLKYVKILN